MKLSEWILHWKIKDIEDTIGRRETGTKWTERPKIGIGSLFTRGDSTYLLAARVDGGVSLPNIVTGRLWADHPEGVENSHNLSPQEVYRLIGKSYAKDFTVYPQEDPSRPFPLMDWLRWEPPQPPAPTAPKVTFQAGQVWKLTPDHGQCSYWVVTSESDGRLRLVNMSSGKRHCGPTFTAGSEPKDVFLRPELWSLCERPVTITI